MIAVQLEYRSIDMIYNGALSNDCIVDVTIDNHYIIPGTRFTILVASDQASVKKIEIFLHQKFAFLMNGSIQTSTRNFLEVGKISLVFRAYDALITR